MLERVRIKRKERNKKYYYVMCGKHKVARVRWQGDSYDFLRRLCNVLRCNTGL